MKLNKKYIEEKTGKKILYYDEISSTSDVAREIVQNNEEYNLLIAEVQTKGKGTNGRVWLSEKEKNILMTLIYYPEKDIKEFETLTYDIAVKIKEAIFELYGIELKIKYPNDLLLNNKKICGILTESIFQEGKVKCILIGIGFDVLEKEFPKEIKDLATSLKKEYENKEFLRDEIIVNFVRSIDDINSLKTDHSY